MRPQRRVCTAAPSSAPPASSMSTPQLDNGLDSTLEEVTRGWARGLPDQAHQEKSDGKNFDWWRNWYPVQLLCDLDPAVPNPITLLGKRFVVWQDGDKVWRCAS